MITRVSAFIDRNTSEAARTDDLRARVLVLLCQSRMSVEDLALALNCSESMVRSLLVRPFRSLFSGEGAGAARPIEPLNLRAMPELEPAVGRESGPGSADEAAREQERHARLLAAEVRRWLCTFEVSDADRQRIVEDAETVLIGSPLNEAGKFDFSVNSAFLEVIGIWGRRARTSRSPDFRTRLSQWLASWIRFWVTDTVVWGRVFDLAFDYFGEKVRAAA